MTGYEDVEVSLKLPARLEILWPLDAFLVELLDLYRPDIARECVDALSLIVHEAFTNICVHTYQPEDHGVVVVRIELRGLQAAFVFEDTGKAFDEAKWRVPDLEQPLESGRGIWLMKELSDEFIYEADRGGMNILTLVKTIDVASRAG